MQLELEFESGSKWQEETRKEEGASWGGEGGGRENFTRVMITCSENATADITYVLININNG